jgi:hypothetical protein
MSGISRSLTTKSHHVEVFGQYKLYGFQYEAEGGELGWHITSAHIRRPVKDYWVADGNFIEVRMHLAFNHNADTLFQTFGPVTDVDPEEMQVILDAIARWEAQDQALNSK